MANNKYKKNRQGRRQVRQSQCYASKAFYVSPRDPGSRIPELYPLKDKIIVVFGVGCLGAPSVLEFARAGVKEIRILDYDIVDPATTIRWPLGLISTGHKKVTILSNFIQQNYPYTTCQPYDFKLGGVKDPKVDRHLEQEFINEITKDCDLIYDTTAELGVQSFLTDFASSRQITYIGLAGTYGAWGGNIFRIRPWMGMGCFFCYLKFREEGKIQEPSSANIETGLIQPTGCADPTFTGAGFDMLQIALMGVRVAVSTLCEEEKDAYPTFDKDIIHVNLRDEHGAMISPCFQAYNLTPHPECKRCHGKYE